MTTKLTLSIEQQTVERAKLLSAKSGKSLSKIVEEYLDSITTKATAKRSAVEQLEGILKQEHTDGKTWKEIKASYIKHKYGISASM